ncbi:MAG: hypothetical protein LBE34_00330 [Flavobacteriaceae bacterium]|nr:hypothetical protein [Flavobacteriaceae bacterium]
MITNSKGEVVWVDASDEVIIDAVKNNETVTVLEDKGDGTFLYYNEKAIDSNGNLVESQATRFDANTLSIEEYQPGIYRFSDKKGVITDLDIRASNIIFDDNTIGSGNDNVQDVIETIFEKFTYIDSQRAALKGKGILVNGEDSLAKTVLQEVELSIADNAIETSKIVNNAVTTSKVANHSITEDKLWVGEGREKQVAVVQTDGSVKFQELNTVVAGKMLEVDNSLSIEGLADEALLSPLKIMINEAGIVNKHIENNAVTTDKIGSEIAGKNYVLTADGSGNSTFNPISGVVASAIQGDLVSDDAISIEGGENILFGNENKKTIVSLNDRGVKGNHIATKTIVNENIADKTIASSKLTGGDNKQGAIATVIDNKGTVAYQTLKGEAITDKAALKTDGIITIGGADTQEGTLLKEATLSIVNKGIKTAQLADNAVTNLQIADQSVTSNKISSENTGSGKVLMSGEKGIAEWKDVSVVVNEGAGNLTSDSIIKITGNGEKALLNNIDLSISENSITIDKLNSTENGANVDKNMILAADGDGGFKYFDARTVSPKTDDLILGDALEFTNSTTGKDAVLIKTSFDVKNLGITEEKLANHTVTTAKMSSVGAKNNTVLTADGQGNVTYKKINDNAFEGAGANLESDGSLQVLTGKNAVLTDVTIGIAENGVQTEHIKERAVTTDKIGAEGITNNFVLVAKDGGAEFSSLTKVIEGSGKEIKSGAAIKVTGGLQAALKDVTIEVADLGITNGKIATKTITASKFNAEKNAAGTVLTSLGDGEAKYLPISQYAKPLKSDSSIEVSTDKGILLDNATIKVKNGGIITNHLGAKVVTVDKISSKVGNENVGGKQILMADGDGGVYFGTSENVVTKGDVKKGETIFAKSGGAGAVLQDVTLEVVETSIETKHLKDNAVSAAKINANAVLTEKINHLAVTTDKIDTKAVTTDKIADEAITTAKIGKGAVRNGQIAANAVGRNEIYQNNIDEIHMSDKSIGTRALINDAVTEVKIAKEAITTNKIAKEAVTTDKIKNLAVTNMQIAQSTISGGKLADKAVTPNKMGSGGAEEGYVLTAGLNGEVAFKPVAGGGNTNITKKDIKESNTIKATKGAIKSVLEDVQLDVIAGSITNTHIARNTVMNENMASKSVDYNVLGDNAVHSRVVRDKGISAAKISSENDKRDYVLTADGNGGAYWKEMTNSGGEGGTITKGDLKGSSAIDVKNGSNAVLRDVTLDIKGSGIERKHISGGAVSNVELANKAVHQSNMSSIYDGTKNANRGYVLTADGSGGVSWDKITNSGGEGGAITKGNLNGNKSIKVSDGSNAVLKDVNLSIERGGIGTNEIADEAVGTTELKNKAVTNGKISSEGALIDEVLTSDGRGGAYWQKVTSSGGEGSVITKGNLNGDSVIKVNDGSNAVLKDVTLEIREKSIGENHIQNYAIRRNHIYNNNIDEGHLSSDAVSTRVIENRAVTKEKINSQGSSEGEVMTSDGKGGVRWETVKGNEGGSNIAAPKFFYLPAIYVDIISGQSGYVELHREYKNQFGSPMVSSLGGNNSNLPVYGESELNYYVTYYDKDVFEGVNLDSKGNLSYKVKTNAKPSGRTFFNIVLEVK